jgi:rfaE bifunctional protein nucleotidyltransferase chain/domain
MAPAEPAMRGAAAADTGARCGSADGLRRLREQLPRPLVFTNGVFDLVHAGHVDLLQAARRQGASLVVGINGDTSARRLRKGHGRLVHPAADRARVVGALAGVDAVVIFDEDKPLALMCALRPDVYLKGEDCNPTRLAEAALMAEWGGCTTIVPRGTTMSTRGLMQRLQPPRCVWSLLRLPLPAL